MGAKPGAEVLHFLTGGSVIFLIMFNEYLQVQAVANLISEIDICLCHFSWVPSQVLTFCIFSQGNQLYSWSWLFRLLQLFWRWHCFLYMGVELHHDSFGLCSAATACNSNIPKGDDLCSFDITLHHDLPPVLPGGHGRGVKMKMGCIAQESGRYFLSINLWLNMSCTLHISNEWH